MADISHLGLGDDVRTAEHLVEHVGVAAVPARPSTRAELGHTRVRFAFCKRLETLEEAGRRLKRLGSAGG